MKNDLDFSPLESVRAYRDFAELNGFNYDIYASELNPGPGTLMTCFDPRFMQLTNEISGFLGGLEFSFFHLSGYLVGGNQRYVQNATVIKFVLPRTLPHFVINAHLNDIHGSVLPTFFDRSQRVVLEGDFSKFFGVYAPTNYESSVVNLLAPDIMEALLMNAAYCDIEIIDNCLYFYWPSHPESGREVQKIFTTACVVMDEMRDKLIRSDIYVTSAHKEAHTHGKGVHLKRHSVTWAIIGAISLSFLGKLLSDMYVKDSPLAQQILITTIFIIAALYGLYVGFKKHRLKKELEHRNKVI